MLYVEYISLHSFFFYVIPYLLTGYLHKKNRTITYFSCTYFFEKYVKIFFKDKLKRFDFEIRDIKDDNGECIISKIGRSDAINFTKKITSSKSFNMFNNDNIIKNNLPQYIIKSFFAGGIPEGDPTRKSLNYNLLLIRKVHEHNKQLGIKSSNFVFLNRPWFELYKEYSLIRGIKILKCYQINTNINSIIISLATMNPRLGIFLKLVRNYFKNNFHIEPNKTEPLQRILFEGLGEFILEKNGYNTDFFFYLYSPLEARYLSSTYEIPEERISLIKEGIMPVNLYSNSYKRNNLKKYNYPIINMFKEEKQFIRKTVNSYLFRMLYWKNIFLQQNIKFYLTWHKFDGNHIAIHDAIYEIGGISAIWDRSFEGESTLDYMTVTDINFTFSDYSHSNHHALLNSKVSYSVVTGYLRDYSKSYVNSSLKAIRNNLQKNGAEIIVSYFDQNSTDEFAHNRERESYKQFLKALLKNTWLGVVIKPKKSHKLRNRLGEEISQLINKAIKSGRCHIFEESGKYQSNVPVVFASNISDICVHNALYAGTAALECALTGKPTILLDVAGHPYNRLYELEKDKVIFKNINDIIDALIDYYKSQKNLAGLGDWSKNINNFDTFQDGKGAFRMGSYIQAVMTGFEKKMERSDVLERAADIYCKEWGYDKITRGGLSLN
jgi:hypothetical protein